MVQSRADFRGHEFQDGRRIWLIRHGETTGGSSVRYYGATDVPLSDLGREQVRSLGPIVRSLQVAALAHSPLSRARESAQIVAELLAEPPPEVHAIEELRELDFGRFEGWTADEIAEQEPDWYRRWQAGGIDGYPEGETLDGFAERVGRGLERALQCGEGGDLCIVAHRGIVKTAVCRLCELPRSLVRAWPLDLGSAVVIVQDAESGRFLLERYNLVAP